MALKIGIDVGGTFTDFFVTQEGSAGRVYKILSTPADPSIALVAGLEEIARDQGQSLEGLAGSIDTIVHGTTVTTNAVLTGKGAKTGLITTRGVRDALEMRRGIREERYNNRYRNAAPLVPRYLRLGVGGRLDYKGGEIEPLSAPDVRKAVAAFRKEGVQAVAVCFMNSYADAKHEREAADIVRSGLPGTYLTVSSELIPSIRFYDRVSTTVLNSYVGPALSSYLDSLRARLSRIGFAGTLLIMQSNGGVVLLEVARARAATTLLSGPAAGPGAGSRYARALGRDDCITIDMGGTSFDAALVLRGAPPMNTEGEINRHRIALPMMGIMTIGAGGGSVGWMDEGGLLRMGPQSAGADPGPACYGKGGSEPTCTDADLVLGYLAPDFFAGGRIRLDLLAAKRAISARIAKPLGVSVEEAAAGMYRVINTNMAQGVREVTIKRGYDPREFPIVVAGGAGPLHSAMICRELGVPLFVVPRDASVLCAAGMLMSDLRHDFVRSFVSPLDAIDVGDLRCAVNAMVEMGRGLLAAERLPEGRREFHLSFDCRYIKQYHEVCVPVPLEAVESGDLSKARAGFHAEHNRLYGYSLEEVGTPVELINLRLCAVGLVEKPELAEMEFDGEDPCACLKGERRVYLPEESAFREVKVYDGHKMRAGNRIYGPALIEQVNTTLFLSASFDCVCDKYSSFVAYAKGQGELLESSLRGQKACAK